MKTKSNKDSKRLVLLDAYAILHRAYHALPDFSSSKGEPTGALYGVSAMLLKIIKDLKPDYIVACYDLPEPTHRHEIYDNYKLGRPKPEANLVKQIDRSRDIFKAFHIPLYEKAGFEADDILGTIVEKLKGDNIDIIVASGDMDTLQLVDNKKVRVYTLKKGINDTILYDEIAVQDRFGFGPKLLPDYKGLRGDPSDNIIGIQGIGEKTATILIQNFGTIENIYKQLKEDESVFLDKGIKPRTINLLTEGEEDALFSKELATIRLDAPIDFSLPKREWRDAVEIDKIISLFQELSFRTLSQRVRDLLTTKTDAKDKTGVGIMDSNDKSKYLEARLPNEEELQKVAIAVWLLDSNITKPTLDDIMHFSGERTFVEARAFILREIKTKKLETIYEKIELPLMPILKKMEREGIKINTDYLQKLSQEYHAELDKLKKKIWQYTGEEFNINSSKQLAEILFDKMELKLKNHKKTTTGKRTTKESELKKMLEIHPIIGEILKYRELQKLLSTYVDNLPKLVDKDQRLHTSFLQTGTTTGRMSSCEPNLQNIPIRTELGRRIRNAFTPEKGFDLVSFDYSQVELRVAAMLSKDEKMINIFKQKIDVHTAVASEIFGVPLEKVNNRMRRKAKIVNFGIIYGMGINSLRQNMEDASNGEDKITRKEAQEFYNRYFETFKSLAQYLENSKIQAAQLGYTKTFFGRLRHFEGINSKIPFIKAMAERMAINAPIQGTSADIIKLAMIKIDNYLSVKKLDATVKMLLQVHDELIFEIKKDADQKIYSDIKKIMETVIPPEKIGGVIFEINLKKGANWGELKELK
ncbi:MAG: DNA polymerase [Patescibacteria group bacterium]